MKIDDITREMLPKLAADFPMKVTQAPALMKISIKTLQRLRNQSLPPPLLANRPNRADDGRRSDGPAR